jgi:hypothetical protein
VHTAVQGITKIISVSSGKESWFLGADILIFGTEQSTTVKTKQLSRLHPQIKE